MDCPVQMPCLRSSFKNMDYVLELYAKGFWGVNQCTPPPPPHTHTSLSKEDGTPFRIVPNCPGFQFALQNTHTHTHTHVLMHAADQQSHTVPWFDSEKNPTITATSHLQYMALTAYPEGMKGTFDTQKCDSTTRTCTPWVHILTWDPRSCPALCRSYGDT